MTDSPVRQAHTRQAMKLNTTIVSQLSKCQSRYNDIDNLARFEHLVISQTIAKINAYRSSRSTFWINRLKLKKIRFIAAKFLYLRRGNYEEVSESSKASFTLFRIGFWWLIAVAATTVAILLLEHFFSKVPFLPDFPNLSDNQLQHYSTITMGISAIGGVFIGLYYSGLTAAAGAVYANAPHQVRDLLVREKSGSTYMIFLAFLTTLSLFFSLVYLIAGISSSLAMCLLIILSGFAVFGFVILGKQAFNFFNPVRLSLTPLRKLHSIPNDVVLGGFLSSNPDFQLHAKQRAIAEINVLDAISQICRESDNLQTTPYSDFCSNVTRIYFSYRSVRSRIPVSSKWFAGKYVYPDWYRQSEVSTDMSLRTGTMIHPDVVANLNWLEIRLWKVIFANFKTNLDAKNYVLTAQAIQRISSIIGKTVDTHDLELAIDFSKEVFLELQSHIKTQKINTAHLSTDYSLEYLQMIGSAAVIPTEILLAFSRSVNCFSEGKLAEISEKAGVSGKIQSDMEMPLEMYRESNDLAEKLRFEKRIEGKVISPPWYISELLRYECLKFLKSPVENFFEKVSSLNPMLIDALTEQKDQIGHALIISQNIEFYNKLTSSHWAMISDTITSLSKKRKIEGLNWPIVELDKTVKQIKKAEEKLTVHASNSATALIQSERNTAHPDFLGQFIMHTHETFLGAALKFDKALLKQLLFEHVFNCFQKYQQMRPKNIDINNPFTEHSLKMASAPLLDLMELLGIVKIMSEFHSDDEVWNLIQKTWDALVAASGTPHLNQICIATFNMVTGPFSTEPRSTAKFGWRSQVSTTLSSGPYAERPRDHRRRSFSYDDDPGIPNHQSNLVNAIMPTGGFTLGGSINGTAVFIHEHLRNTVPLNTVAESNIERRLREKKERLNGIKDED